LPQRPVRPTIAIVKKELRARLREVLASISPEEIKAKSIMACHRLVEQPEYIRAEVMMVFLSLPNEIDTTPLVLRAWQDQKRVLAPKLSWEQRRMLPIEIRSLTEDLSDSMLGIREPAAGVPIPIEMIDLVIVPGLAFDQYGNRLGRGRGFYDRFLAHPEYRGVTCALAMEEQVTDHVPAGPLDRSMDMLVTDVAVRRFKRATVGPNGTR
jgi:5-formyltetrahydrofolate cyclo-ligase